MITEAGEALNLMSNLCGAFKVILRPFLLFITFLFQVRKMDGWRWCLRGLHSSVGGDGLSQKESSNGSLFFG